MSMSPSEICFPSFAETCSFSFDLEFNWKENTKLLNRDYKMPVVMYSFSPIELRAMGALRHKKQELRCFSNTYGSLLLALRFTHYERKTRDFL